MVGGDRKRLLLKYISFLKLYLVHSLATSVGAHALHVESYAALERAIRSLAGFYSKAGPFAKLPEDVKRSILDDLSTAEAYL